MGGDRAAMTARGNAAGEMPTRVKWESRKNDDAEPGARLTRTRSRCMTPRLSRHVHAAAQKVKLWIDHARSGGKVT
jgi:hypothetical protein